jgi:hypothetical protein
VLNSLEACFAKIHWQKEYFIAFTCVDIARSENRLAIQVHGPYHYQPPDGRLNISSRFNQHLFAGLGWSIVIVPYFEWDELSTQVEKNQYLHEKLDCHLKNYKDPNIFDLQPLQSMLQADLSVKKKKRKPKKTTKNYPSLLWQDVGKKNQPDPESELQSNELQGACSTQAPVQSRSLRKRN